MFCNTCYLQVDGNIKRHFKTKKHLEASKMNALLQVVGEHVNLITSNEDRETIDPSSKKSHNYHEFIKASQTVSREGIRRRTMAFSVPTEYVELCHQVQDELLRQADRIMYMNDHILQNQ